MKIARVLLFCLFTWLHGLVLHGPHGEQKNKNSLIQEDFLKPATILIDDNGLSFGRGCGPNQKNPKLAVCVAGLSRLFASDLAIPRLFQEEVLNKTSAAGAVGITRNLPDVFVHIKLGGNDRAKTENVVAAEMHATDFVVEDGDGTKHLFTDEQTKEIARGYRLSGVVADADALADAILKNASLRKFISLQGINGTSNQQMAQKVVASVVLRYDVLCWMKTNRFDVQ